jgi:hypothetical protein
MSACIAYQDDGRLCRAPAAILDHQRGGLVCLQHAPEDVATEAFDTYHCPTHGPRRYSRGEVRQAERDETCLYVCTLCDQVADPTPFDAGAEEEPRC